MEHIKKYLSSKLTGEVTNILPFLRENIEHLQPEIDRILELELQVAAWRGEHRLKNISYNINEAGVPHLSGVEPDRVMYAWRFDETTTVTEMIEALAIVLIVDCTGCCDALDYINLNEHGFIAQGDVSGTYHS